jgi:hypothetical protein
MTVVQGSIHWWLAVVEVDPTVCPHLQGVDMENMWCVITQKSMDLGMASIHQKLHTGPLQWAFYEVHTHIRPWLPPPVHVRSLWNSVLLLNTSPSTTCNNCVITLFCTT